VDKSSSLNNLTSKEKKNKSALRPKENNSKLSDKAKSKSNSQVKKNKDMKRPDSYKLDEEEKLQINH
jgi:hypothetical protein